jgi:hypothetical protein
MKRTIISLATASLIASSAMAADKGIDFTTTGQAVVYYQTAGQASDEMFDQKASKANVGVQLNIGSDLGNGFTLGSQLSYLGTTGLEKNLVSNTAQVSAATNPAGSGLDAANATTNQLMLTKIFVAKTVANTTVKLGRQELPKSLSPLAFSEGWNVFKNTFDAVVAINSDLPNTTIVGAYVGRSTGHDLSSVGNLTVNGSLQVNGAAYMLTAQNTSLPMTTVTASYYALKDIDVADSADAIWVDAKIADKSLPMGLKVGLQGGTIMPEASGLDDTTAFGLKAGVAPVENVKVCAAFSTVNDGTAHVVNTGGVKTPLYTQLVANQGFISSDNNTFMLKGAYSLGEMGTVIAQGTYTQDSSDAELDSTDLELLYKTKVSGVNLLAAYVRTNTIDDKKAANNIIRVVARYAF